MAGLAVDPALGGSGLDHGVLARDVVGRDRYVDGVADPADDVEVAERRLDHHDVGALLDVEERLADALDARWRRPAGRCAGRPPASWRPPRGTGRRRRRRTSPSRRGSRRRCVRRRRALRGPPAPGRPSSRWARPCRRRRRPGPRAISAYTASVRSLSTRPSGVSTPQWPWSVNSSRHRSLITVSASPTSPTTSVMARLRMPAGSTAPEPSASLCSGMPKSITPPSPRSAASATALSRVSRVCWTTPGIDAIGTGSTDALAHEQRQHQLAGRRRGSRRPSAAARGYDAAGAAGPEVRSAPVRRPRTRSARLGPPRGGLAL